MNEYKIGDIIIPKNEKVTSAIYIIEKIYNPLNGEKKFQLNHYLSNKPAFFVSETILIKRFKRKERLLS